MTENKLTKFADAIIDEGWLLDDLTQLSVAELQEVSDSVKMKKGFATRFQKAIGKLKTPEKSSPPVAGTRSFFYAIINTPIIFVATVMARTQHYFYSNISHALH